MAAFPHLSFQADWVLPEHLADPGEEAWNGDVILMVRRAECGQVNILIMHQSNHKSRDEQVVSRGTAHVWMNHLQSL